MQSTETPTETPAVYARRGGAYLLDDHAGVLIDSAGNYSAKTRGNPHSLATLLRSIADDIDSDQRLAITVPAPLEYLREGPSVDCPQHGEDGEVA
ncbi:hypothetical protein AB0230_02000 [Microbacterium sp. NPDC089190]|uniref:hypothetical protein n=1 Tax=Microbacterium sp. NPDC089190 TaxID=3155063 RepID=UPI00344B4A97